MNNFKILDCTIRDGGYYNNWDFSINFANKYLKTLAKTSVEFVEIGFRKPPEKISTGPNGLKKLGKFLTTSEKTLKKLIVPNNIKIAAMIDLSDFLGATGLKNIQKTFIESKRSKISMVRIACNEKDIIHLPKIITNLKKKKYTVAVNLMKFTTLNYPQIYKFFSTSLKHGADYLYIADSFGNCLPKQIYNISKYLKRKHFDLAKFGFHAHNNMGNALKNSIAAVNSGFTMIDTSVMGMGRGAGNLDLGHLAKYLNKIKEKKTLDTFSHKEMSHLKKKYKWGKNSFYEFSAKNNIHPTFVQRLLSEEKFNKTHTLKILNFLKKSSAMQYDMNIFDNLFLDVNQIKKSFDNFKNKKIILLCDNLEIKKIDIKKKRSENWQIGSLNYIKFVNKNHLDFIFQCNAYRVFTELEKIATIKKIKLIMPNYVLLSKLMSKLKNKIIKYNISKSDKISILKNQCEFKKNLVLLYALSFCISKRFNKIVICGLTKNDSNMDVLGEINRFLINSKLKISIKLN